MTLKHPFKRFFRGEAGAVSMEVIALGGAAAFLGVVALAGFVDGVEQLDQDRGYQLKEQDKVTTF